jgi:hypothetical protein
LISSQESIRMAKRQQSAAIARHLLRGDVAEAQGNPELARNCFVLPMAK